MKEKKKNIFSGNNIYLVISILVISFLLLSFFISNKSLKTEYSNYKYVAEEKISQLEAENEKISSNLSDLNVEHISLEADYSNTKTNLEDLSKQVDTVINLIDDYKLEISESMEWFKENSVLGSSSREDRAKSYLDRNCIEITSNACSIKTGCFYLINEEYLDLTYKEDNEYSLNANSLDLVETDVLYSLTDFLDHKGGDCEDYALFYKAEMNYLVEFCEDKPVIIESWFIEEDSSKRHWLDYDKDWFLDDVSEIEFVDFKYPNVVCGNLYDLNAREIIGHCMIALTIEKIDSINDLKLLENAPLIEPQNGMFEGYINEDSSGVYLLEEGDSYDSYESFIYQVISDYDHFSYSRIYGVWQGYTEFSSTLTEHKDILLKVKSGDYDDIDLNKSYYYSIAPSSEIYEKCDEKYPFKCGNYCYNCDEDHNLCCNPNGESWCCPVGSTCDIEHQDCITEFLY